MKRFSSNKIHIFLLVLFFYSCKKQQQNQVVKVNYKFDSEESVLFVNYSNKKLVILPFIEKIFVKQNASNSTELLNLNEDSFNLIRCNNEDNINDKINLTLKLDSLMQEVNYSKYFPELRETDSLNYFNRLIILYPNTKFQQSYDVKLYNSSNNYTIQMSNFLYKLKEKMIQSQKNSERFYVELKNLNYKDYHVFDDEIFSIYSLYITGSQLKVE